MRILALASLVALSACNGYGIHDDLDFDLHFFANAAGLPASELHSPYVLGAQISLYGISSHSDEDFTGWQIVSDDPSVLEIQVSQGDANGLYAGAWARRPGRATLEMLDASHSSRASAVAEVKAPDEMRVLAHGPLIIGDESGAQTTSLEMLAGGTSTFMIRWFAQGQELWGTGALAADSSAVEVKTLTTAWNSKRDWLQLSATSSSQDGAVQLGTNVSSLLSLPVKIVSYSDISSLELRGQDESAADDGTYLSVLAQARDADGTPIYGVDYSFDVDGEAQGGFGDIYVYEYEKGTPQTLTASLGNLMNARATIHSGGGYVESSNDVGCDSPGAGVTSMITLLGLAGLMRRRRAA